MLLFATLSVATIVLAVVLAMTLWRVRKSIDLLERRVDDSLRQVEMTAEDLRKTNAVLREILIRAERGMANVEHVTEGVRGFRRTIDVATSVLEHSVVPLLGTVAGGLVGAKAAVSHVVNRFSRREGSHE